MEADRLVVVGRIQEQHPERCRLFMQWRQLPFPILVDPLDLLELTAVPILTGIDEHGVAHEVSGDTIAAFAAREFGLPASAMTLADPGLPDLDALRQRTATGTAAAWGALGAALYLWTGDVHIDEAIHAFRKAVVLATADGRWHFRLGVCLRRRYESAHRQPGDFQAAVDEWHRALALDPNQYIWRRRIQQYGPRLDKPYPFYDWVLQARGEVPVPLPVEPAGAEYAEPLARLVSDRSGDADPDPDGRISRDPGEFIRAEVIAVPATIAPGGAARVHAVFRPNPAAKAHWNNEAEDLRLWIDPAPGWELERRLHSVANPPDAVSSEVRRLDFEIRCDEATAAGAVTVPAYVLYYVCEDVDGTCLFRRQDIDIRLNVE